MADYRPMSGSVAFPQLSFGTVNPASPPAPSDAIGQEAREEVSVVLLVALRRDMVRFAQLQLRDAAAAEDMVQDTIEAALRGRESFQGKSSLKTWVFAILRNRIVDHIRQASRTVAMSDVVGDEDGWEDRLDALFTQRGAWTPTARPAAWRSPDESLEDREFWAVFETCLDHVPANPARVFMMREFLGFEADEICKELGITTSNCHVLLHRARLKLRDCMQRGWGRPETARC